MAMMSPSYQRPFALTNVRTKKDENPFTEFSALTFASAAPFQLLFHISHNCFPIWLSVLTNHFGTANSYVFMHQIYTVYSADKKPHKLSATLSAPLSEGCKSSGIYSFLYSPRSAVFRLYGINRAWANRNIPQPLL